MTTIRTCPDWPDLMELAPNLQFKHYTATEAHLPAEVLMKMPDVDLETSSSAPTSTTTSTTRRTPIPGSSRRLQDTHFYELQAWADEGRGEL